MGLFDAKIMEDLEVIRRVRKAFAHARRPINFSTPEIVEESQKLKTMGDASHPVSKIFDWTGYQRANDYRDLFVITAFSIWMYLGTVNNVILRDTLDNAMAARLNASTADLLRIRKAMNQEQLATM